MSRHRGSSTSISPRQIITTQETLYEERDSVILHMGENNTRAETNSPNPSILISPAIDINHRGEPNDLATTTAGSSTLQGAVNSTISGGEFFSSSRDATKIVNVINIPGYAAVSSSTTDTFQHDSLQVPRNGELITNAVRRVRERRSSVTITSVSSQSSLTPKSSSSELYKRALLPTGHGFPLWIPQPNTYLPNEYRKSGVRIGDVGILTADGAFDFLFNIALGVNQEINPSQLPEGFQPLRLPSEPGDMRHILLFNPGDHVSSTAVEKSGAALQPSGQSFRCSESEGAILTLPDGASREDLVNYGIIRKYANQHKRSWYKYTNSTRGREAKNHSLYLVTGFDKSTSWGIATFSKTSKQEAVLLQFNATSQNTGERTEYLYTWQSSGTATTRTSRAEYFDNQENPAQNQCNFLRGMKISLSETAWAELFGPTPIASISETKEGPSGRAEPSKPPSNGKPSSRTKSWFSRLFGRHDSGSNDQHSILNDVELVSNSSADSLALARHNFHHPSDAINHMLLSEMPDAEGAITHDDVWCSVLHKDNSELPDPITLLKRVKEKYNIIIEEGAIFLEPRGHVPDDMGLVSHVARHSYWIPNILREKITSVSNILTKSSQSNKKNDPMIDSYLNRHKSSPADKIRSAHGVIGFSMSSAAYIGQLCVVIPPGSIRSRTKKALLIAVQYKKDVVADRNKKHAGPHSDVQKMKALLTEKFGYSADNINVLSDFDSSSNCHPTRHNILSSIHDFLSNQHPGDDYLFLYSGISIRKPTSDGEEEFIVPCDSFEANGSFISPLDENLISAQELKDHLVNRLNAESKLMIIMDTEHCATLLESPQLQIPTANTRSYERPGHYMNSSRKFTFLIDGDPSVKRILSGKHRPPYITANRNVICIAALRDSNLWSTVTTTLTSNIVDILGKKQLEHMSRRFKRSEDEEWMRKFKKFKQVQRVELSGHGPLTLASFLSL